MKGDGADTEGSPAEAALSAGGAERNGEALFCRSWTEKMAAYEDDSNIMSFQSGGGGDQSTSCWHDAAGGAPPPEQQQRRRHHFSTAPLSGSSEATKGSPQGDTSSLRGDGGSGGPDLNAVPALRVNLSLAHITHPMDNPLCGSGSELFPQKGKIQTYEEDFNMMSLQSTAAGGGGGADTSTSCWNDSPSTDKDDAEGSSSGDEAPLPPPNAPTACARSVQSP
ncbi:hypothetical protein STCU_10190 [Strigomonas culicis]|uniref:Uncharacterized protein n=1 Tax=Strigomonas culicis TaxID=28005 RepID=S9TN03_9TRYP|nr:hypothetical protein STCU_10190 [Strigomonas culicis]|eukprot:EPY18104.1 hypothetical protein STCU_10190 [Strigomonas culicis]